MTNFTERSHAVMQLADQEAKRFNHDYVGTEHILLGLIKDAQGVASQVLRNLDVDLDKCRTEVEKIVQPAAPIVTTGRLPHTPRAKKVLEYAADEASNLKHAYVGTEHLLLGLLRERDGVAAQVLNNLGLTLEQVREEVMAILGVSLFREKSGEAARKWSENMRRRIDETPHEAKKAFLVRQGWRRTSVMRTTGLLAGIEFWAKERDGPGSVQTSLAYKYEIMNQEREKRESEKDAGVAEIRCNKCGTDLRSLDTTEDGRTICNGYFGLVDATVSGGYFSEHLSDCTNYRFSLCEKCLVALFDTFKTLPDVTTYGP